MSSRAGVGRTSTRYDSAGAASGPRYDSVGEQAAAEGAAENAASSASSPGSLWRRQPSRVALAALLTGLIVTGALSLTSAAVYNRNERRLLNLRVREVGLVLAATAPSTQTPLASAAELANATGGSPQKFRAFMAPYVGPGRQFTSVSLWPLGDSAPRAEHRARQAARPCVDAGKGRAVLQAFHPARCFEPHRLPQLPVSGARLRFQRPRPGARVRGLRRKPAAREQALEIGEELGLLRPQLRAVSGSLQAHQRRAGDQPEALTDQGPAGLGRRSLWRRRVHDCGEPERLARRLVLRAPSVDHRARRGSS